MSINPAISANLNAMQMNYTPSTVNTYDTHDVWNGGQQQGEEAGGLQEQNQQIAQQDVTGARGTQQSSKTSASQQSSSTQQTSGASESGAAAQAENTQDAEVAARTLRLSMADNSRELQAKFGETQATKGDQQANMTSDARRQVMLRNMENMVNLQLAQYTGNEPYSRANYREILGALSNMQGNNQTSKAQKDEKSGATAPASENEGEANETSAAGQTAQKDGVYKLYSGQAAKTLAAVMGGDNHGGDDDAFDMVA